MGSFTKSVAPIRKITASPRILIWVGGMHKRGKTHLALTSPSPIAYFDIDGGMEDDVLPAFLAGNHINAFTGRPFKPVVHPVEISQKWRTKKEFEDELKRFDEKFFAALDDSDIRTVVIDTWAELRSIVIDAMIGPDVQAVATQYAPVNARMMMYLDSVTAKAGKNLILLSHLKEDYAQAIDEKTGEPSKKISDSYATGTFSPAGHKDTGKKTHCYVECDREFRPVWRDAGGKPIAQLVEDGRNGLVPAEIAEGGKLKPMAGWRDLEKPRREKNPTGRFYFTIQYCRQNAALAGQVLEQPDNTIPQLAMMLHPETDPEYWCDAEVAEEVTA